MRFLAIAATIGLLASGAQAWAMPAQDTSWGKAGVSLEQYARDARECADTSRQVAVHIPPQTLAQLDGLSSAQLLDMVGGLAGPGSNAMNIVGGATSLRSEQDIARRSENFGEHYVAVVRDDVRHELQRVLDQCLAERGYVRIRFTGAQQRQLKKLKPHSAARTAYLHALDTDPTVVAQQRIAAGG